MTHQTNTILSDKMDEVFRPHDIVIPVMGVTGSGKSSFVAQCIDDESGVGHGLQSFTKTVSYATLKHRGHRIRLIDTPGFDDSEQDDTAILNEIAMWLALAYSGNPPILLSGVIYLHPISSPRMKGSDKSNLAMFQAICGHHNLSSVVFVTTMCNKFDKVIRERRTAELMTNYWQPMLQAGSKAMEHDNTKASALRIIDHFLDRSTRIELNIQVQMIREHKSVEDTDAGRILAERLQLEHRKTTSRLDETRQNLEQALARGNESETIELIERQQKYYEELDYRKTQMGDLKVDLAKLIELRKIELEHQRIERSEQREIAERMLRRTNEGITKAFERQDVLKTMSGPRNEVADRMNMATVESDSLLKEMEERQRRLDWLKWKEQREFEERMYLETIRITKEGVKWGQIGAAAGLGSFAIAAFCSIM